jgi:hypothetical protein
MTAALVVGLFALLVVVAVLTFLRDERRARDVRDQGQARLLTEITQAMSRAQIEQAEIVAMASARSIEAMATTTAAQLESLARTNATQLEALARLMTTGVPDARTAVASEHSVDAAEIVQREVTDDAKRRGIEALRAGYKTLGMEISDEALAEEVDLILAGVPLDMALGAHAR